MGSAVGEMICVVGLHSIYIQTAGFVRSILNSANLTTKLTETDFYCMLYQQFLMSRIRRVGCNCSTVLSECTHPC